MRSWINYISTQSAKPMNRNCTHYQLFARLCQQSWSPRFKSLGNDAVICFYVLFLTLLAQKILSVITYSREELLDIRVTSTYQHYDQEYNFPEADPLFGPPPRALYLIPETEQKQRCRRRRGRRSGLLVRLRMRAHHPPPPSILLTNVQSLDNLVDEIRARVAFQRDQSL